MRVQGRLGVPRGLHRWDQHGTPDGRRGYLAEHNLHSGHTVPFSPSVLAKEHPQAICCYSADDVACSNRAICVFRVAFVLGGIHGPVPDVRSSQIPCKPSLRAHVYDLSNVFCPETATSPVSCAALLSHV